MVSKSWIYVVLVFVIGLLLSCLYLPELDFEEKHRSVRYVLARRRKRDLVARKHFFPTVKDTVVTVTSEHLTADDVADHPRMAEYCGHPLQGKLVGEEGSAIPGFRLRKVLILLTPGQRAEVVKVRNISSPRLSCNYKVLSSLSSSQKIKSFPETVEIYKHMQPNKGGFKIFPMMPRSPLCGEGQLSPLGVNQLITLGQNLGKVYQTKLESLQNIPKEIVKVVKSSPEEAAYQSTVAFLHGFLHEKHFVQMFIDKSLRNFCQSKSSFPCFCPKNEFLERSFLKAVKRGFLLFKDSPKHDAVLNKKVGIYRDKVTPREIISLSSAWICDQQNLPCKKGFCLNMTVSNIDHMFRAADSYIHDITSNPIFSSYSTLYSYPFLTEVFHWLNETHPLTDDFSLYSASDAFMVYVATALGVPVNHLLSPASRLIFEVHENSLHRSSFVLRVFLNGKNITSLLPACISGPVSKTCSLTTFVDFYHRFLQEKFTNQNYRDECLL